MARTVKDKQIGSREARRKLKARGKPYWRAIDAGDVHIGYRRNQDGGRWCVRRYIGAGRYEVRTLDGIADDTIDANGVAVLDFGQAIEKARAIFLEAAAVEIGKPYTVKAAMTDYRADYVGRGGRGLRTVDSAINARINPALGAVEAGKLTTVQIRTWLRSIAAGGRLARAKANGERRTAEAPEGPDATRKRRAAANRILTVLKAGLNFAWKEGEIPSDREWRRVKPFHSVDEETTRYLSADECGRLVNASSSDFRQLVQAALLTGCRYGELIALRCADFDEGAGTLPIRASKSGKARHVVLTDEGRQFFGEATAGKTKSAVVFLRDGAPWRPTDQRRPMIAACQAARISPPVGFHVLRHSHASFMASRGVPLDVIGQQLGHADMRMTKRYSHLAPSYVAETIRANFPTLGIVKEAEGGEAEGPAMTKRRTKKYVFHRAGKMTVDYGWGHHVPRRADAYRIFDEYMTEQSQARRPALLAAAERAWRLGTDAEARDDHKSRPPFIKTCKYDDRPAHALMEQIELETGERSKETLAAEALRREPNITGGASPTAKIKRLAKYYRPAKK